MTAGFAASLCKYGVAVRCRYANRPDFVIPASKNWMEDKGRHNDFKAVKPNHWRQMAPVYERVFDDWEPAFPKDIITLLATLDDDFVRFAGQGV